MWASFAGWGSENHCPWETEELKKRGVDLRLTVKNTLRLITAIQKSPGCLLSWQGSAGGRLVGKKQY